MFILKKSSMGKTEGFCTPFKEQFKFGEPAEESRVSFSNGHNTVPQRRNCCGRKSADSMAYLPIKITNLTKVCFMFGHHVLSVLHLVCPGGLVIVISTAISRFILLFELWGTHRTENHHVWNWLRCQTCLQKLWMSSHSWKYGWKNVVKPVPLQKELSIWDNASNAYMSWRCIFPDR